MRGAAHSAATLDDGAMLDGVATSETGSGVLSLPPPPPQLASTTAVVNKNIRAQRDSMAMSGPNLDSAPSQVLFIDEAPRSSLFEFALGSYSTALVERVE